MSTEEQLKPSVAAIVGSAFYESPPEKLPLKRTTVYTEFGPYDLFRVLFDDYKERRPAYLVFRHGLPHRWLPHMVPYRAMCAALKAVNCKGVLVTSSVGVLDSEVPLFELLDIEDLLVMHPMLPDGTPMSMWQTPSKEHGHLVVQKGLFDEELRVQVNAMSVIAKSVLFGYVPGPRTKTAAESALWARLGAQVNSMTLAPEVTLLNELEIPCVGVVVGHVGGHKRDAQGNLVIKDEGDAVAESVGAAESDANWDNGKVTKSLEAAKQSISELVVNFLHDAAPVNFQNSLYRFAWQSDDRIPDGMDIADEVDVVEARVDAAEFLLNIDNVDECAAYLRQRGWLSPKIDVVRLSVPGDGNMNCTLRAHLSNGGTLIVKQARPFVEKHPTIAAPVERALTEYSFYEATRSTASLSAMMPRMLDHDRLNCILLMQDLGDGADLSSVYKAGAALSVEHARHLSRWLAELHTSVSGAALSDAHRAALRNAGMRALNAEHIFRFPFMAENGFDLDTVLPGLQAASMAYKNDEALRGVVNALAKHYEAQEGDVDTGCLLHGDFYPGSWMVDSAGKLFVIDPEFAFIGAREFDIGVMLAHLRLAEQSQEVIETALNEYVTAAGSTGIDAKLLRQFAAVEVLRRLIGLAQLPLSSSLETRKKQMEEARTMLLDSSDSNSSIFGVSMVKK